jgi:hypothetical protein
VFVSPDSLPQYLTNIARLQLEKDSSGGIIDTIVI